MKTIVIDTETTGLLSNRLLPLDKQPRIIEIYACSVDFDTGDVTEILNTLLNPQCKLDAVITKITGLRDVDLINAPLFNSISDVLSSLIESHDVMIAHNASFDKEMIELEYERLNQKLKWNRCLCTVEQTIYMKGFRLNLQALHELLFGEKFKEGHRAKIDVLALTRCCFELHKRGIL